MKRGIALLLCALAAIPVFAQKTSRSASQGTGSVVIVFKDGHRQTISTADIARIEFTQATVAKTTANAAAPNAPQPGRNHFLGKWQVQEGGGRSRSFFITLNDDGTAEKSIGASHGHWEVVDGEARIAWDDGWHDIIRKTGSKHEKFAFEPGRSFSDSPSNVTDARPTEPRL